MHNRCMAVMLKRRLQTVQTADHADCADHADWEFFLINLLFFSFFYPGFLKVCLHILFTFCYAYRFLEARYGSGKMYNQCPSSQKF